MEELFGRSGGQLWRLAQGIDDRQVVPDREAKMISHETTFAQDIADIGMPRAALLELTEQVGRRLRRHGLSGRTVHIKVRSADFRTITRAQTLSRPTDVTQELLTIITHSATLTFAGMFTNNGTVISDPSDHYFSSVQIGSTGALVAGSGDRMFVSGNFLSSSTNNTAWNTTAAELLMVGHGAQSTVSPAPILVPAKPGTRITSRGGPCRLPWELRLT